MSISQCQFLNTGEPLTFRYQHLRAVLLVDTDGVSTKARYYRKHYHAESLHVHRAGLSPYMDSSSLQAPFLKKRSSRVPIWTAMLQ
jgi:hypothetical protein